MNRRRLLLLAVGVGAVLITVLVLLSRTSEQQPRAVPAPRSTAVPPTPTAAPTVPPPVDQAIDIADRFATVYLSYDWQHPQDQVQALLPLTSDRLYQSLVMGGVDSSGAPAPWTEARADLHEEDSVQVDSAATGSELPAPDQAAVQLHVTEEFNTDVGHGQAAKELDLGLTKQPTSWVVDAVTERSQQ